MQLINMQSLNTQSAVSSTDLSHLVCSIMLNILGEASGARGKQSSEALMARAIQTLATVHILHALQRQPKCT